jgi:hypothetical protein
LSEEDARRRKSCDASGRGWLPSEARRFTRLWSIVLLHGLGTIDDLCRDGEASGRPFVSRDRLHVLDEVRRLAREGSSA